MTAPAFICAYPFELETDGGRFAFGEGETVAIETTEDRDLFVVVRKKKVKEAAPEAASGEPPAAPEPAEPAEPGDDDDEYDTFELEIERAAMGDSLFRCVLAEEELDDHAEFAELALEDLVAEACLPVDALLAYAEAAAQVPMRRIRVVRQGKAMTIMVPTRRRRRILSARERAQRRMAGRIGARSAGAKRLRARSIKIRKSLGLEVKRVIDRGFMESADPHKYAANLADAARARLPLARVAHDAGTVSLRLKEASNAKAFRDLVSAMHVGAEVACAEDGVSFDVTPPAGAAAASEASRLAHALLNG